jgi:3-oxoacyl-[acyl-carrier-protein] synthase-3
MPVPSTACIVQDKLGIPNTALAFDCNAACTGFLYALTIADGIIASGFQNKKMLVFSSEAISRIVDYEDRGSCILFGDGCGAAVVGISDDDISRILYTKLGSDGSLADMITVPAGGSRKPCSHETVDARENYIKVAGRIVFKTAVRTMTEEPELAVKTLGITLDDIKLLIPHQANIRIIESGANKLNFPMERVFVNIHKYGNTSGATIPIGLDESIKEGRIKRGDLVMMISFGAGYTYGTIVLQY